MIMIQPQACILLALVIASAAAQEAPASSEAAPEPYSYAYQTDSHSASEQRDPSGKVTGFYTLSDADGRERRVEYVADETGFRAKVVTNEVGTKSESPADVEVNASEPTPNQYVAYQQAPAPQVQYQARQQVVQQVAAPRVQQATTVQQQARGQSVAYTQQPGGYGYGNGAYYGSYYNPGQGYSPSAVYSTGYGPGYGSGYGSGYSSYSNVGNYNNHLPSQYYRSVSSSGSVVPSSYTVNSGNAVRYVSQPGVTTTGVRTVNYPAGVSYGASYGSPASVTTSTRTVSSSSSPSGSSNYLVLQK